MLMCGNFEAGHLDSVTRVLVSSNHTIETLSEILSICPKKLLGEDSLSVDEESRLLLLKNILEK